MLQISLTSESISNNPEHQNISEFDVFGHHSENEFVAIDRVPMSHQGRAEDTVAQICDVIRNMADMAVQENPQSNLVVSFPVFRGNETHPRGEDVFDFINNFKIAATLNGWSNEDLAIGFPLYLNGHASLRIFL